MLSAFHTSRKNPYLRPPNVPPSTPSPPLHGGVLSISITTDEPPASSHTANAHALKFARELEQRCALDAVIRSGGTSKGGPQIPAVIASDKVENAALLVRWEPAPGALAISLPSQSFDAESMTVTVVGLNLPFSEVFIKC